MNWQASLIYGAARNEQESMDLLVIMSFVFVVTRVFAFCAVQTVVFNNAGRRLSHAVIHTGSCAAQAGRPIKYP